MHNSHMMLFWLVFCVTIQCISSRNSRNSHSRDSHSRDSHSRNSHKRCAYGGYGPSNWWCKGVCATAPDQTPIDIDTDKVKDSDAICTGQLDWKVEWDHEFFQIENTCSFLKVTPVGVGIADIITPFDDYRHPIAILNTKNTPFEDDFEEYCLAQFHFRWGEDSDVGSEHLVDGEQYPLEVQFVHYACEYGTLSEAFEAGEDSGDHTLAVVGYFFEISKEDNPAFDIILSDYLKENIKDCNEDASVTIKNAVLNDLIPDKIEMDGYWSYQGGLSTPPCTNIVNWFVLKTVGTISERQIKRFRELLDDDEEEITRNWRKPQDRENTVFNCDDDKHKKSKRKKNGKKRKSNGKKSHDHDHDKKSHDKGSHGKKRNNKKSHGKKSNDKKKSSSDPWSSISSSDSW